MPVLHPALLAISPDSEDLEKRALYVLLGQKPFGPSILWLQKPQD